MHIVFAASECEPFARTGGLADVIGALPRELARIGQQVTVFIPLYRQVRGHLAEELTFRIRSLTIPFAGYNRFAGIVDGGERDGVQYYFVDCPQLFDREGIYGPDADREYPDNAERYGLFCRAVLEAVKQLGVPDIFHLHDWQTALVPVYLKTVYYFDPVLQGAATVLTIHNAAYQGQFSPDTVPQLLFPWDLFHFEKAEQNNRLNFLKGGVVFADTLTTVSPTYAKELQTPEFGEGLDPVLRKRSGDLRGILDGVDYAAWNPERDPLLAAHYSSDNLDGKRECRRDLLHAFGLEEVSDSAAVIGMVSRFVTPKGFDFLSQIAEQLLERDVVLVAAGGGEPLYENFLHNLAAQHPEKAAVRITSDEALVHKVEAGADVFLMPSHTEPFGRNEIYAMRYGTLPVVRGTGGLEDTVEDSNAEAGTGTGFKFHGYNAWDLLAAIDRALSAFQDKEAWRRLMRNGMAKNFSWETPARKYLDVYEEVLRRKS